MAKKVSAAFAADAFAEAGEVRRASPKSLAKLKALCDERDNLKAKVAELQEQMTLLNTRIGELDFNLIPKAMKEGGMLDFTRDDGTKLKRDLIMNGSFPKEGTPERDKAFVYLRKNDGGHLIRPTITVSGETGSDKQLMKLFGELRRVSNNLDVSYQTEVNTGSLKSWAKERMEEGKKVDLEVLGIKAANGVKYIAPRTGGKKK